MHVVLVGLGRWGEKHLRALRELGVTPWVAEISATGRARAIEVGIPAARVVADYRDVLGNVDAVDIVTPADSHLAIAETALAAARHCFIEKPLTASAVEGRALVAAAARGRRVVQVGHIFRFHPVTQALREALLTDRIGAVRYGTARFSGFKRPRTDVGVTHTDAIHFFDLFAHLLGRDATAVQSVQRDFLGRGLDDMSVTTVTYGDVPVTVEANYFVPGTHRECVIVGERGSLVADYGDGTVALFSGTHEKQGETWAAIDTGKEQLPVGRDEPLKAELAAFMAACAGGADNPVPVGVGLRAVEVVEAAAEAARAGRTVPLR